MGRIRPSRTTTVVAAVAVAVAVGALASRSTGEVSYANSWLFVLTSTVAAVAVSFVADGATPVGRRWRGLVRVAAVAPVVYVAAMGASVWWPWTVPVAMVSHVPIIALVVVTPLVAVRLIATTASMWPAVVVGTLAVLTLVTWTVAELADDATATVAFTLANSLFLLSSIASPVVAAWHARCSSGERRRRLALVTVSAVVPFTLVALCAVTGLAAERGGADADVAASLLLAGLALAVAAVTATASLALRTPLSVSPGRIATASSTVLGVLAALVAVGVAVGTGGPTAWVAVAAVLVTALAAPARQRLSSALVGEEDHVAQPTPARLATTLTPRENEVLALLGEGLSNAGIAQRLVLSERTVDAHLRSVFTKLDLPTDHVANRRVHAALAWRDATERAS